MCAERRRANISGGAGIESRCPGGWGRPLGPSKPAINLITDSGSGKAKPGHRGRHRLFDAQPGCGPASHCEPYRELIAQEFERGRNAMGIWQDLVDGYGFGAAIRV